MKAIALAGLSVAIVFTLRALAQPPAAASNTDPEIDTFVLKIKKKANEYHPLKDNTLKAEADFVSLLCDSNRSYEKSQKLHFKSDKAGKEFDLPGDCVAARSAIPSAHA